MVEILLHTWLTWIWSSASLRVLQNCQAWSLRADPGTKPENSQGCTHNTQLSSPEKNKRAQLVKEHNWYGNKYKDKVESKGWQLIPYDTAQIGTQRPEAAIRNLSY